MRDAGWPRGVDTTAAHVGGLIKGPARSSCDDHGTRTRPDPKSRRGIRSPGCWSARRSGRSTTTPGSRSSSCWRSRRRRATATAQGAGGVRPDRPDGPADARLAARRASWPTGSASASVILAMKGFELVADAGGHGRAAVSARRAGLPALVILGLLGRPGGAVQPGQVRHPPRDPAPRAALVGQRPAGDVDEPGDHRRDGRRGRDPLADRAACPGSGGLVLSVLSVGGPARPRWRSRRSRPRGPRGGSSTTVQDRLVGDPRPTAILRLAVRGQIFVWSIASLVPAPVLRLRHRRSSGSTTGRRACRWPRSGIGIGVGCVAGGPALGVEGRVRPAPARAPWA